MKSYSTTQLLRMSKFQTALRGLTHLLGKHILGILHCQVLVRMWSYSQIVSGNGILEDYCKVKLYKKQCTPKYFRKIKHVHIKLCPERYSEWLSA